MGDADFARCGIGGTTEQADVADRVVRGAKGATGYEGILFVEQAADAVDFRRLDRFVERHGRHDGGNALGEHAFPRTRRADQKQVVGARDGDLDGAFDLVLALDLGKIDLGG